MKIKHRKQNLITFILITFIVLPIIGCSQIKSGNPAEKIVPGDDLQAVLESGNDLVLQKAAVYDVKKTLKYKFPNQKITTKDAIYISDYATLRIAENNVISCISRESLGGINLVDGFLYPLTALLRLNR